jgi:hypothetical protein
MSKFASLTAGLLARKGEAEPSATPFAEQLLTRVGMPADAADVRALTPMPHHHAPADGKPPMPKPLSQPVTSIFGSFGRRTPEELEHARHAPMEFPRPGATVSVLHPDDEEHVENHCGSCPGPNVDDAGKTFHVNLRLKRQRFVKLKLSAALLRRPVQDIVAEALDTWFDKLPSDVMGECACLKARGE